MTKCSGITRAGTACRGIPIEGSTWCYVHDPDHAEERRRHGSRGGKRGGRGRPQVELADIKTEIRSVIDAVRSEKLDRSVGAVVFQGFNTLLKAVSADLAVREQLELIERLEELEAALEHKKGERGWRGA